MQMCLGTDVLVVLGLVDDPGAGSNSRRQCRRPPSCRLPAARRWPAPWRGLQARPEARQQLPAAPPTRAVCAARTSCVLLPLGAARHPRSSPKSRQRGRPYLGASRAAAPDVFSLCGQRPVAEARACGPAVTRRLAGYRILMTILMTTSVVTAYESASWRGNTDKEARNGGSNAFNDRRASGWPHCGRVLHPARRCQEEQDGLRGRQGNLGRRPGQVRARQVRQEAKKAKVE